MFLLVMRCRITLKMTNRQVLLTKQQNNYSVRLNAARLNVARPTSCQQVSIKPASRARPIFNVTTPQPRLLSVSPLLSNSLDFFVWFPMSEISSCCCFYDKVSSSKSTLSVTPKSNVFRSVNLNFVPMVDRFQRIWAILIFAKNSNVSTLDLLIHSASGLPTFLSLKKTFKCETCPQNKYSIFT